jgi:hypothetical protein
VPRGSLRALNPNATEVAELVVADRVRPNIDLPQAGARDIHVKAIQILRFRLA